MSIITKELEKSADKLKWYDFIIAIIPPVGIIAGIIHLVRKRFVRGEVILAISIVEAIIVNYLNKIVK
jgi:hypothetical protein